MSLPFFTTSQIIGCRSHTNGAIKKKLTYLKTADNYGSIGILFIKIRAT